jgi:hypothetical protein
MTISNAITELDASGNYTSEADYARDLNDPRMIFDGGFRAAIGRKAARSRMQAPAPVKEPRLSWNDNPGRFDSPTTNNEGAQ